MSVFKHENLVLLLLLQLVQDIIPLLVELLVLLDMRVLYLLPLLGLLQKQLLPALMQVLLFQLNNPVLGHLRL